MFNKNLPTSQNWEQDDDIESQLASLERNHHFGSHEQSISPSHASLSTHSTWFGGESPPPLDVVNVHYPLPLRNLESTTVADVMFYGLHYAGFDSTRQQRNNSTRRIGWFKSFYGVEPTTVSPFFQDLKNEYPDVNLKIALMTLQWFYLYPTYPVLSGQWKWCEEFIGSNVVDYGFKMASVGRKKIVFELRDSVQIGRTVDCSTFMIFEMRLDPSSKWFDYKTHSCCLKYEFCLAIYEDRVVWINGPFPPSIHDVTVFRGGNADESEDAWDHNSLYFKLGGDEQCIADSGYAGEPKCVLTKEEHSNEFKEFSSRAKNRQETFHWRLKAFNILGGRFRHGKNTLHRMKLHKMAVEAVAGIVQCKCGDHLVFNIQALSDFRSR